MRFELERGKIDEFASLLNYHWELSRKVDAGSTNTLIDQIFLSIEDLIDAKMVCGAGGGGFLQVILKKGVQKTDVHKRLKDVFQDNPVDVWNCEILQNFSLHPEMELQIHRQFQVREQKVKILMSIRLMKISCQK